jgi:hypothetical protein
MAKGWCKVSELLPSTGLIVHLQVIHEYGEPRWDDIDRGKSKNKKMFMTGKENEKRLKIRQTKKDKETNRSKEQKEQQDEAESRIKR